MTDPLLIVGIALVIAGQAINWLAAVRLHALSKEVHDLAGKSLSALSSASTLAHGYLAVTQDRDALIQMILATGNDEARQWIADRYATQAKEKMH